MIWIDLSIPSSPNDAGCRLYYSVTTCNLDFSTPALHVVPHLSKTAKDTPNDLGAVLQGIGGVKLW